MSHIIVEATLHEQHNGAGQGQEVKHAEPRARVRLLSLATAPYFRQAAAHRRQAHEMLIGTKYGSAHL